MSYRPSPTETSTSLFKIRCHIAASVCASILLHLPYSFQYEVERSICVDTGE